MKKSSGENGSMAIAMGRNYTFNSTHPSPRLGRFAIFLAVAVALGCFPSAPSLGNPGKGDSTAFQAQLAVDPFIEATDRALEAWTLTQSARSPEDWDRVARAWIQAVAFMQSVPPGDPKRAFAQKKVVEYLRNAAYALSQAEKADLGFSYPTFNNPLLDEKLVLYRSYARAIGPADILVVGSSRAAQGLDPRVLQYDLAARGYPGLRVFNFGIHGATAQVVDLMLREILTPEQLPRLILWVDGARALNSGRVDRTYNAILSSLGYQRLQRSGLKAAQSDDLDLKALGPETETEIELEVADLSIAPISLSVSPVDANGFISVLDRFDPDTYYKIYPYVSGQYDGDYEAFYLGGVQDRAMDSLLTYAQSRQIPVVFVNLPLTQDYLDPVRLGYEQLFRRHMQQLAGNKGFLWRDLYGRGLDRNDYFADPSHLNAAGAAAVSRQLANDSNIPWPRSKN